MESLHYNLQDNNLSTKTIVQSTDCISASSRRHCSPFRNDWASIVKEGLALVLSVEHWGTKIKPSFPYQKDWRTSSNWDYMCDLVNYSRTYWPLIFWRTFEMTLFCLNWEFDFFFFLILVDLCLKKRNCTFQIMDMWKWLYFVHVLKLSGYSTTEFP